MKKRLAFKTVFFCHLPCNISNISEIPSVHPATLHAGHSMKRLIRLISYLYLVWLYIIIIKPIKISYFTSSEINSIAELLCLARESVQNIFNKTSPSVKKHWHVVRQFEITVTSYFHMLSKKYKHIHRYLNILSVIDNWPQRADALTTMYNCSICI